MASFFDENNLQKIHRFHVSSKPIHRFVPIHRHGDASQMYLKDVHLQALPPLNVFESYENEKPENAVSENAIINRNKISFKLKPKTYVKDLHLKMTIENSDGAATIAVVPCMLINKIEILDSDGHVMQQFSGEALYLENLLYDDREQVRLEPLTNIDATSFEAKNNIGAGAQATYLLKIPGFFSDNYLHYQTLNSDLEIDFTLQPLGSSNAANTLVKNMEIISRGQTLVSGHNTREIRRLKPGIQRWRTLSVFEHKENIDMAANNTYNIRLNSIKGLSAYLVVLIRDSNKTYANMFDFVEMDRYQLLDKHNNIVGVECDKSVKHLQDQSTPSNLITAKPGIILINFSMGINAAHQGRQVGFYHMTGDESLELKTGAGLASSNYEVRVLAYEYFVACVNKGMLSGFRS